MKKAAAFDHVCGKHADGKNTKGRMIIAYRSEKTFRESDCMPQDCDNTEKNPLLPDLPADKWKTPADVRAAFPGVAFYVVYSRNNMKAKNGLPARPKFNVYFVMRKCTNAKEYQKLKQQVQQYFPAFDIEALGAARFLFGVENPVVEYYDGDLTINEFMESRNALPEIIAEGERNSTISSYAARVFKIPYDKWFERGLLRLCAGNTINYSDVTAWFVETVKQYELFPAWVYYDSYSARYFVEEMQMQGFNMVRCIQGAKTLSLPMQMLGADLQAHRVIYNNNPVLKWCLTNTGIQTDRNGNIVPVKNQSPKQRIDGTAALLDCYVGLYEHYNEYTTAI